MRIALHGGSGFVYARDRYEPLVGNPGSMLLCARHGEWRQAFYDAFVDRLPRLEAHVIPTALERGPVEDALMGLSTRASPSWATGLPSTAIRCWRTYVNTFYVGLIDAILAS